MCSNNINILHYPLRVNTYCTRYYNIAGTIKLIISQINSINYNLNKDLYDDRLLNIIVTK